MVTIICPVYNAERYLDDCIESLIKQTYKNLEIILIDDGSNDRSLDICDKWALKDKRIKVVHNTRGGVSKARNTGVKIAKGEYLFFIDADDTIEPDAIEILLKYYDGKKDTIVVLNYNRFTDNSDQIDRKADGKIDVKKITKCDFKDYTHARRGCYIWGMLISKIILDEYKIRFNEEMYNLEDAAWLGITICYIRNMIFIEDNLYHYRMNPTSITSHCVDYAWQAKGWLCVRKTVHDYFKKGSCNTWEKKNIYEVDKYCRNNFHAECFAGNLMYKQIQSLCEEVNYRWKITKRECLLYKMAFLIRRLF